MRYCAFNATFEAMEASFFRRVKVLKYPGRRDLMDNIELIPEEFVVKENLNYNKEMPVNEGVTEDDKTIKTSNVPSPPVDEPPEAICRRPLTSYPNPPRKEDEDKMLAATNNQTELMRWHYHLGHLPFLKLKQFALNGEIPKKLAKVKPPRCTGCLFSTMTKAPWNGKETKASHKVFVATKPGECVSVDQLTSTELGFFAQLKAKRTKKHYRCATIFVNQFCCLRFVHLQVNDSSVKTVATKHTFKTFATKHCVKILHCHCNNGQFSNNAFKQACQDAHQQLTFCGVNTHFQNGTAKRSIRNLSKSTCKQSLHARACWPTSVNFAI